MRIISSFLLSAILVVAPISANCQFLPPPPKLPTLDSNGVDVQSGEIQYSQKLVSIGPEGIGGLNFTFYLSGGVLRDNFKTQYIDVEQYSEPTSSAQEVAVGNFSESFSYGYPEQGNGSVITSDRYYIQKDGTATSWRGVAGSCSTYPLPTICTSIFFADTITYPNGISLTFHYRDDMTGGVPSTRLQSVTSNTGYQMKFYYMVNTITDPASRNLWYTMSSVVAINNAVEYCDPSADSCTVSSAWPTAQFSYDAGHFYYTDPLGNQTRFTQTTYSFGIKTPDNGGSTDNISYTLSSMYDSCAQTNLPKVTSATINGRTTSYSYLSSAPNIMVATAPLAQQNTYVSSACRSGVKSITDPLGRVTTFDYDKYIRLLTTTFPEGNHTTNAIDAYTPPDFGFRGNITQTTLYPKPGSGAPTLSESRTFPPCDGWGVPNKVCNQPSSYTDPRGHTTNYEYSSDHGGLVKETDPSDANGINPVKRYAYAQRYAWIKDAGGSYVQAPSPIWVRTEERTCATTATVSGSCAGGSSDEIVTDYDYGPDSGPNNLLLRGKVVTSNGVSLRTCYGYDQYGNKISEASPRAGLTSCP